MSDLRLVKAANTIKNAKGLVITAGAGMGVDSGLPDFRGDQGFWKAYPMYQRLGLSFIQAANPQHFEEDPQFGWGFYGHRTNLYRRTTPHLGFTLLQRWIKQFNLDHFIVTSNVDGQFQKAGFSDERIYEVHGSIHHLQCTIPCQRHIWTNDVDYQIDESTMQAQSVPQCPQCQRVARPNILMFGDYAWVSKRSAIQAETFDEFLAAHQFSKLVVIEIGAGSAIPTIRHLSEQLGQRPKTTVLRINPREPHIKTPHISLIGGAVEILTKIDATLKRHPSR